MNRESEIVFRLLCEAIPKQFHALVRKIIEANQETVRNIYWKIKNS